jgi:hypothetical protein
MQALEFTRALWEIVGDLKVKELLDIAQPWTIIPGNNTGIPEDEERICSTDLEFQRCV